MRIFTNSLNNMAVKKTSGDSRIKVIITNATNKNTLSVLRNIKKEYQKTVIKSINAPTLSQLSKYCDKTVYIGMGDGDKAYESLMNELKVGNYDVLIPVGLDWCTLVNKHAKEIKTLVKVMTPTPESFVIASQKDLTMNFAEEHGVPIPKTVPVHGIQDLDKVQSFPCVMKPATGSGLGVYYCNSSDELLQKY